MARGGINGRDRIADWLDREVYGHARMSDLAGPPILLNAVELYTGMPFVFAEPWFDALCSDLRAVRVADAVAASAAYPFAVRPVVLGAYGRGCDRSLPAWVGAAVRDPEAPQVERDTARSFQTFRDPAQIRFLHLLDGGVIDNFGLSGIAVLQRAGGLPYGPLLAPGDVVRMTRLRVIVVNGEKSSRRSWGQTRAGPNGMQVMAAIADHSTDAAKRNAYDAFVGRLAHWEQDSIAWRCSLTLEEARRMGAPDGCICAQSINLRTVERNLRLNPRSPPDGRVAEPLSQQRWARKSASTDCRGHEQCGRRSPSGLYHGCQHTADRAAARPGDGPARTGARQDAGARIRRGGGMRALAFRL